MNPEGYLATQDLKDRGWTPGLIARFLGEHDLTRPNGLRLGRRRLPPVKLYREARVREVECQDAFLAAQAKAADARERADERRLKRELKRGELLEAAARTYVPSVHPEPLRKGAVRKAREPYLAGLEAAQERLLPTLGRVTEREREQLAALLRAQLDRALAAAYPWYPDPDAPAAGEGKPQSAARPSDWRDWDWD